MNDTSSSRAEEMQADQPVQRNILVWDLPVRLFHWLMVVCFVGAYLTAESERWRLVHVTLGYTMAGLVVFRIVWGFVGTRYARFSNFVRGPKTVAVYLRSLLRGNPEHYVGHNPAGALAIMALLGLTLAVAATGWSVYNEIGGDFSEELHEAMANIMLALIIVHIAAVLISSRLHHENLILAMLDGYKSGSPEQGIRRVWRWLAIVMLIAVLGFWWMQGQMAATGSVLHRQENSATVHKG